MEEDWSGYNVTNVEFSDVLVDSLRSKQLRSLEDQRMARLLVFGDLIEEQSSQIAAVHGQASDEEHTDPSQRLNQLE